MVANAIFNESRGAENPYNANFITDKNGRILSVVLDYETYKKMEETLLDYGLAKAMEEVLDDEEIDLDTAKGLCGYGYHG